jgi:GT2 family glycosyltransferase
MLDVAVSCVLFQQRHDELVPLLESLDALVNDSSVDVLFVDNSPDETLKEVVKRYAWAKYLKNPAGNKGFGHGHNLALSLAPPSRYFAVVNPDIAFSSDAIGALKAYMDVHEDVSLAVPRIVYPDGRLQYLCKRYPTVLALFGRRFLPAGLSRSGRIKAYLERFEMRDCSYDEVLEPMFLSGAFMFFRRMAIEQVGGFDEGFFLYLEDADITIRIKEHGRAVHFPDATVQHAWGRGSHKSLYLTWVMIQSTFKFFNKHGWRFVSYQKPDGVTP